MEYYSAVKKNEILSFASELMQTGEYNEYNKPETQGQISHVLSFMQELKLKKIGEKNILLPFFLFCQTNS